MKNNILFIVLTGFLSCLQVTAQNNATLEAINKQVWVPYIQSFATLDAPLFKSVHAPEMVCIEADAKTIKELGPYVEGYQQWFNAVKQSKGALQLTLRFFERIHTEHTASERGVYQMQMTDGKGEKSIFYGQFHILLKKKKKQWEIVMDYDSSVGNTIGEEDYLAAKALQDVSHFTRETPDDE